MFGNPRCQCGVRLSAHPAPQCPTFKQRLARRTPLKSTPRKSKHSAFASSLGLRRSTSPGKYKKRLWAIFSEYIRRRDADPDTGLVKCISCPTVKHWKEMDCGHFIPKSLGTSVYFEERNCANQCQFCNLTLQGNQYPYALALIERFGPGIVEELHALAKTQRQIKEPEWLELITLYKQKLKSLGGTNV